MIKSIDKALSSGDLLKIDYKAGKNSLCNTVINPLSIKGDTLTALVFSTGLVRKLKIGSMTLHAFSPQYVDGHKPDFVDHLRWYIGPYVPELFNLGWLISSDEEYIGIYPRSDKDTVSTDKPFSEHQVHLQYINGSNHPFHVWNESGDYYRFAGFDQAMDEVVAFTEQKRQ